MIRSTLSLLLFFCFVVSDVRAQCPITDLSFERQTQIDSLPINYPDCNDITVNIKISGDEIYNLDSLIYINTIRGNLAIENNKFLKSLKGLDSLKQIFGELRIINNDLIINLSGLDQLEFIGSNFFLAENNYLTSTDGVGSLIEIGETFESHNNTKLISLNSLKKLKKIGNYFAISRNDKLENLNGLESLEQVGNLEFHLNPVLYDLSGLKSLHTIKGDLKIDANSSIKNLNGLQSLNSVGNLIFFDNNALENFVGLNSLTQIYSLTLISNPNLKNFEGLNSLKTVHLNFVNFQSAALLNFIGLDSLQQINGDLSIVDNSNLRNLSGLNSLQRISETLEISENPMLEHLKDLSLDSVGSGIYILNNDALESLEGLDKMNTNALMSLIISGCELLSNCAIESICKYLQRGGFADVSRNRRGCNSEEEIRLQCITNSTNYSNSLYTLYPNPGFNYVVIKAINNEPFIYKITDNNGSTINSGKSFFNQQIDVSDLIQGYYFLNVSTGKSQYNLNFIKI